MPIRPVEPTYRALFLCPQILILEMLRSNTQPYKLFHFPSRALFTFSSKPSQETQPSNLMCQTQAQLDPIPFSSLATTFSLDPGNLSSGEVGGGGGCASGLRI